MYKENTYYVSVNEWGSVFWRAASWGTTGLNVGDRHRIEGPACEYDDGTVEYYLNGKQVTKEEHERQTNPPKKMTVAEVSKALGYKVEIVE